MTDPDGWTLTTPGRGDAATVASWSRSAAEAARWVSRAEHPFPPRVVAGWWDADGVSPRLLRDPDGAPAAYGEVWDDEDEDEVELARLLVDPTRRRQGVGRRLVDGLLDLARTSGRSACHCASSPPTCLRGRCTPRPGSSRSTR